MTNDDDETSERPLNISRIRRHGWSAAEIKRATKALGQLHLAGSRIADTSDEAALLGEFVLWVRTTGDADAPSLARALAGFKRQMPSVTTPLESSSSSWIRPRNIATTSCGARTRTPSRCSSSSSRTSSLQKLDGTDYLPASHEAAFVVLGRLATDESLRFLVSALSSCSDNEELFELVLRLHERGTSREAHGLRLRPHASGGDECGARL